MKKLLLTALFLALYNAQSIAQNLIPYLGSYSLIGDGRYGYATESGDVVIKPSFQGIQEIMPNGRIFTNLKDIELERILMRPGQRSIPNSAKAIFLLRNGLRIPTDNPRNVVVGVQNYRSDGAKLDSIGHLVVFPKAKEIVFYDLRKNTETAYLNLIRNNSRDWFSNYYTPAREHLSPFRFTEGMMEVWKTPDAMNFVDTELNEIFPRDFAAGRIADANHFILAEDVYKYAIGDRSGKVRTPFVWTSIQPGGREGFFIVTGPRYNHGKSGITGLIDADGKIVLDTVYRSITAFSDMLIVEKDNKFGLMDYAGGIILPITAQMMYPVAQKRWLLIKDNNPQTNDVRSNLLDARGKRMLPEEVRDIKILASKPFPHFFVQFPDHQIFYDTALQQVASFQGIGDGMIVETDPYVFQLSKNFEGKSQLGLYNPKGEMLHPEGFDEMIRVFPHVYRVKKDTLYGVINSKGEQIAPPQFLSIREETFRHDTIYWGEEASGRWMAFSRKGEKLPESGRLAPSLLFDPVIGIKKYSGRNETITGILSDGTRISMPDSLKAWAMARQWHTPNGGLIVYSRYSGNKLESLYFDERMQNLVPPGFVARSRDTETGLVTVMRIKAKPKPVAQKPKSEPEIEAETEADKIVEYRPETPEFDACGVLSADGKWAMPPKTGVIYQPLSPYLVLEIPAGEAFKSRKTNPNLLRIHRVNQPQQPAIEVNYIRDDCFEKDRKTMQMGKAFPKFRDRTLLAYFDEKGNQLTPFGVWNGPTYLKSRNIITLVNPNDPTDFKQLIINEKGETVFDLGTLSCSKFPHEKGHDWKLDYLVVDEGISKEEAAKRSKMTMREVSEADRKLRMMQGLIDSTGRMVLPMRYLNLQVIKPDRLFGARDSSGVALLYNWQGELLHRFPTKPRIGYQNNDALSSMALSDGNIALTDGRTTILISNENQVLRVFDEPYSGSTDLEKRFFHLKDKNGSLIWVRSKDGHVYRE